MVQSVETVRTVREAEVRDAANGSGHLSGGTCTRRSHRRPAEAKVAAVLFPRPRRAPGVTIDQAVSSSTPAYDSGIKVMTQ